MTDALSQIDAVLTAQALDKTRALTHLSQDDARGVLAVALSGDVDALRDLVAGYQAAGAPREQSVWDELGNFLLTIAPYAAAGATILGLGAAVKAL